MTQQKRSDFTQVPNILLDAYDELSETSLVGYLRLIRKYGHKGCFIGSIRKLCKELRMSRMTVYRMIPVWIGSGLAQKGVQPKEDENRDEMIIIISLEALWQENTEYYAKRPNLGQSEDTSVPNWDKDVPKWDSSVPQRDNGVPIWDDFVPTASTKQGGNTSNTNSNTNNTEKEREDVADATARSQPSSQKEVVDVQNQSHPGNPGNSSQPHLDTNGYSPLDASLTSQKEVVDGDNSTHQRSFVDSPSSGSSTSTGRHSSTHNMVTHPPAPKKPPSNKTISEPELTPDEQAVFDAWCSLFKVAVPLIPANAKACKQLAKPLQVWTGILDKSTAEVLKLIMNWAYKNDKNGYYKRGFKLYDAAREFEGWQSAQERPQGDKEESNEHRVSSFGTPGFNFADEFYPSEAEKKAYYAAHPIEGVKV